jgi:1-phosphatidylinositol-4-phosphate 5-kinase
MRPNEEIEQFITGKFRKKQSESSHNSSGKKSVSIHKPLSKNASKSFIHIGHDNWNLVLHMMMGVRQSVNNVKNEEAFELVDQDFERKYCYELIAKKTKNMRLFEFYDFSPRAFHLIRTMYGITPDAYLKSIGPENLIGNLLMGNISSLKE